MKRAANIIGVVLILLGAVWALQGLNILHHSAMSGHVIWTGWGSVAIAFGAGFLVWANTRQQPKP
jgi:hypothetical protein